MRAPQEIAAMHELVQVLPEATLLLSEDGRVLAANQSASVMLGLSARELCDKSLYDLTLDPPEVVEQRLGDWSRTATPVPGSLSLIAAGGRATDCRCDGALVRPQAGGAAAVVFLRCVPGAASDDGSVAAGEDPDASRGEHRRVDRPDAHLEKRLNERRKDTELRESEERFRALVRNSSDVIVVVGADGAVTYESSAVERVSGYKPEELVGADGFALVHPDDVPMARRVFAELLKSPGATLPIELRGRHRDGSWRHLEVTVTNLLDEPSVAGIVANYRDVTERKEAEEALRKSQERHRLVARATNEVIWDHDLTTGKQEWNGATQTVFGYPPEEIGGDARWWEERIHPADRKRVLASVDEILDGGGEAWSHEYRFRRADGAYAAVVDRGYVVRDGTGKPLRMLGSMTDVTDRKRAEEALRESEERYRLVARATNEVIWDSDLRTDAQVWDGAIESVLGYPAHQVTDAAWWEEHVHPEDRERVMSGIEAVLEGGGETWSEEYRFLRADGGYVAVADRAYVVRDAVTGEPVRVIGSMVDVSERRRAEELRARLARQAELRADVSAALAEGGTLPSTLQRCAEAMVEHLGAAFARFWTLDEEEQVLQLRASAGMYTHLDGPHARVPVGDLKIGLIAQERRPHLTNTVASDPRVSDKEWAEREGIVAFAGHPLIAEGRLVGVMAMFAREPLAEDTVEVLASVAGAVAQGVERKRAEEALRRSEKSLAEAQRIAHIGNWEYDLEEDGALWSDEMYRIFGHSPGELVPTYTAFLGLVHPDDKKFVRWSLREGLRGAERLSIEYRIVRPDGEVRSIHSEFEALRDRSDKPKRLVGTAHDVTDRREAEEERNRLASIVASSDYAIVGGRLDGTVASWNSGAEKLYGYTAEEIQGRPISTLVPPDRRRELSNALKKAMQGQSAYLDETVHLTKEGWVVYVSVTVSPIKGSRDNVVGVSTISQDITERKRAEAARRKSEARVRAIVETAPDAIMTMTTDGLVHSFNQGAERMFGYAAEEVVGQPLRMLMPDRFRGAHEAGFRRYLETGEVRMVGKGPAELAGLRGDGTIFPLELSIGETHEGGETLFTGFIRDITERKRAEAEIRQLNEKLERRVRERTTQLRTSEAEMQALFAAMEDLILVLDAQGRYVKIAPTNPPPSHKPSEDTIGKTVHDVLPREQADLLLGHIRHALETQESVGFEYSLPMDGGEVWFDGVVSPMTKGSVVFVSRDTTERRQLEANQQRFLANAAHQLRTPITAVRGAAELLATRESMGPEVKERLLGHILAEGGRMQRLADTLLRMARLGRDLREPTLRAVDVSEALRQAAERIEPVAQGAGISLRVEDHDAGCVRADAEWLQEALLVLLSNATIHSDQGAKVTLRATDRTITVEDEGAGISSEDLPYVFERFYRGGGNTEGFGLGLPICKELIERMGGSISIQSRKGVGTTVKVELPGCD